MEQEKNTWIDLNSWSNLECDAEERQCHDRNNSSIVNGSTRTHCTFEHNNYRSKRASERRQAQLSRVARDAPKTQNIVSNDWNITILLLTVVKDKYTIAIKAMAHSLLLSNVKIYRISNANGESKCKAPHQIVIPLDVKYTQDEGRNN